MDKHLKDNLELNSLIAKVATRDRQAFETLYKDTYNRLNALVLSYVKDETLTYDILQKTYVCIWNKADSFDPQKGKAFTWLMVIARNKSIDAMRKKKRDNHTELETESLEDTLLRSDDSTRSWMLRRLLAPHFGSLSENARRAIILSAVYGMSSREIGEQIGVSTNTVKSWVRRGLEKVKADLDVDDINTLI